MKENRTIQNYGDIMESILDTIKKMLGLPDTQTAFDIDIIIDINMAINTLSQIGVGPKEGFSITGPDETWEEYIGTSPKLEMVKAYIYLKVKQIFDPGSNSLTQAIETQIKELEWRISVQVDP